MSLITACAIFCSLMLHVVCTCTFFGDTICLLTYRKTIKIVTLRIDLQIVLTYDCWHCFLVLNIWVSCFGNDNNFLLPNPWVVLFFIYPTFYSLTILFTQPFSLRCHPSPINNDRSLIVEYYPQWTTSFEIYFSGISDTKPRLWNTYMHGSPLTHFISFIFVAMLYCLICSSIDLWISNSCVWKPPFFNDLLSLTLPLNLINICYKYIEHL
jgi:hypothetical protein